MFETNLRGTLMKMSESLETRYQYEIWFPYTRKTINEIQEGTLLGAPNFATKNSDIHYSILEVVTILPYHYAMEGNTSGYPGFSIEAARNASQDWENQENTPTEDATQIRVIAIPTNLEMVEEGFKSEPKIELESNVAMLGYEVKVLNEKYTQVIANSGIDEKREKNLTTIGHSTRSENIKILLRIEDLYRTHFAIFGFTGVGKSNLLSTIVAKVFTDSEIPLKLVFFDLMSEYSALLMDKLLDDRIQGGVLSIGKNTLPGGLFAFINKQRTNTNLEEATNQLERYTLLPKALVKDKNLVRKALQELIQKDKLKFFNDAQSLSVYDFFFTKKIKWSKPRQGKKIQREAIYKTVLRKLFRGGGYEKIFFNPKIAKTILDNLIDELNNDKNKEFKEDFESRIKKLKELQNTSGQNFEAGINLTELVQDLNDSSHSSLWVIQAHDANAMRSFSKQLGDALYEDRRKTGKIDPLVSFIFDEADEFIKREGGGTYEESKEIAQTLARRGRKFGLGIGIATQRIRYLDTNIMSQPHTYFVSKLPRKTDREAVAEAFGISEELLTQTFKFRKGQWLLMSHDATGLEAIPIPIQAPNANTRLEEWLKDRYEK